MSTLVEQLEYIKHFLEEGKLDKLTPEDHYIRKGQKGYQPDRVKRLKSSKEAWERIKKQMSDAKKAGKPVTYRVEGGTGKTHGNPVVRRAARMYAKKHRLDYKEKSLEHPRSDPADPQSDISKHVKKIRGKKKGRLIDKLSCVEETLPTLSQEITGYLQHLALSLRIDSIEEEDLV